MNTLTRLEHNVQSYLGCVAGERATLRRAFDAIARGLPETVIFGGMLREFGLGNIRSFTSDIDLVSNAKRHEILDAIVHFSPTENRFGGFRFSVDGQKFDLWALEDTWAFRAGLVEGRNFTNLLDTTFFNIDAIAYHIGKRQFLHAPHYETILEKRLLDLNLRQNPYPGEMALKATRMACEKGFSLTPRLSAYILENLDRSDLPPGRQKFVKELEKHSSKGSENFRFNPQPQP